MRLPIIHGVIQRRFLINYRVDPDIIQRQLPAPFLPKLHQGYAIAGICLIRLEEIRPRRLPAAIGISSENAAHRIAVIWTDETGLEREGVFIPRRDTSSLLNHLAGGRLFPGEHHRARFTIRDDQSALSLEMHADDGSVHIRLEARPATDLPQSSIFRSLEDASRFFEAGALGYSATSSPDRLDGVELKTTSWKIDPLHISSIDSSFFQDPGRFPAGSATFDCALIMRNIPHEWRSAADMHPARPTSGPHDG